MSSPVDCPNARTDLSLHIFIKARSVQTVSRLPYVGLLELFAIVIVTH